MTDPTRHPFQAADAAAAADDPLAEQLQDQPADTGEQPAPPAESETLQEELEQTRDLLLRAQAEVLNTRRRSAEDLSKARKFAVEGFAEGLLAVVDSLDAALQVENASAQQLREGTLATHRQLMGVLERNKVVEVNPERGAPFDPTQQHAISMVPAEGQEAGTVVSVLQKGYLIAERVLRPALVTVAEGTADKPAQD